MQPAALALEVFMAAKHSTTVFKDIPRPQLFKGGRIDLDAPNAHTILQNLPVGSWACSFRPGYAYVQRLRAKNLPTFAFNKPPVDCTYTKQELRPNRSRRWG